MTRKLFLLTLGVFVLTAMSWAQVPASAAGGTDSIAPGTVLSVELLRGVDTKKCKANDKIEVKAVTDVLLHGQTVIPRNTEIIGHVTEAKAHSKSSPGSMLGIAFDHMLLKDGREVPLQMTVQAVAPPVHAYGSESDSSANMYSMPGMPRGGTLAPSRVPPTTQPVTPKSPNNMPDPQSTRGSANRPPNSLDSASQGVFGIKGLSLETSGPVSTLSSSTGNVHLDGGTQLALRVQ
jgi:hypothetical protein